MDTADVLRDIGLVLGVGLVALPLAAVLRLPPMVVLVGRGHALGGDALDLVEIPLRQHRARSCSSRSASR